VVEHQRERVKVTRETRKISTTEKGQVAPKQDINFLGVA